MRVANTNNLQTNFIQISAKERIEESAQKLVEEEVGGDVISSTKDEILNFNDAIGYMQVADDTLKSVSQQIDKIGSLEVASVNGALGSNEQSVISSQIQSIKDNISKTISNATYNGRDIFSGEFRVGDMSINLSLGNVDDIDEFSKRVGEVRGDVASFMNSALANIDNLTTKVVNEAGLQNEDEMKLSKEMQGQHLTPLAIAQAHNSDILAMQIQQLLGGEM